MSGVPSWARPGAKVVCVKKAGRGVPSRVRYLSVGGVYTIDRAVPFVFQGEPIVAVTLVEVPVFIDGNEYGFDLDRFRPLVSIEDDMTAHFSKLLDVPVGHELEGV